MFVGVPARNRGRGWRDQPRNPGGQFMASGGGDVGEVQGEGQPRDSGGRFSRSGSEDSG